MLLSDPVSLAIIGAVVSLAQIASTIYLKHDSSKKRDDIKTHVDNSNTVNTAIVKREVDDLKKEMRNSRPMKAVRESLFIPLAIDVAPGPEVRGD